MANTPRFSEHDIDALVGGVLRDEASSVDVGRMLTAIEQRLASEPVTEPDGEAAALAAPGGTFSRRWAPRRFALAATVLIAAGLFAWSVFPAQLSAQALVLAAQENLDAADRCYQVNIQRPKTSRSRNLLLRADWNTLVWTRGDRFRATMHAADRQLVWGQDAGHRIWIVARPRLGLQFGPQENPQLLVRSRELLSLDLNQLTTRFADSYDLVLLADDRSEGPGAAVIRATARPGSPLVPANPVSSARLVIDRRTNVILKLELFRASRLGESSIATFTLLEQAAQPDSIYELTGNLDADAQILGPRQSGRRKVALALLLTELNRSDAP